MFHREAALFCLAWACVAAAGYILEGWIAGSLLSLGMMAVMMPLSAFLITKKEDFALERTARWSILIAAGAILALVHALGD